MRAYQGKKQPTLPWRPRRQPLTSLADLAFTFAGVPGGLKCCLVRYDTVRASTMWLCACRHHALEG